MIWEKRSVSLPLVGETKRGSQLLKISICKDLAAHSEEPRLEDFIYDKDLLSPTQNRE